MITKENKHFLSKVTAKYETCNNSSTDKCMCGLYLETKELKTTSMYWNYAFADGCGSNKELNVKFMNYNQSMKNPEKTGYYFELDCSSTIKDEFDEKEWSNVTIRNENFKCARLNSKDSCLTYVVRIITKKNYYMLLILKSSKFPQNSAGIFKINF